MSKERRPQNTLAEQAAVIAGVMAGEGIEMRAQLANEDGSFDGWRKMSYEPAEKHGFNWGCFQYRLAPGPARVFVGIEHCDTGNFGKLHRLGEEPKVGLVNTAPIRLVELTEEVQTALNAMGVAYEKGGAA